MEMDAPETGKVLESALIDQRMRADRHRANFESLKAQHLTLQESHHNLKIEFESLSKSYDRLHQRSQEIILTLQKERDEKNIECEELKPQVLTSLKLEQLRKHLSDEVEEPYRKRIALIESELESIKSEHSKLKFDYAFLKSEHQAAFVTNQSVVQELIIKHDAELSALIQEKKGLLARQERDVPTDLQRIRQLQRENSELQQRVKGLISENEELVAQKEYSENQSGQNNQVQSSKLAELQAQIKTKELESSSQDTQIQSLQTELNKVHCQYHTLNDQLTQSQREVSKYKRKFEELEHQNAMEISNLKMKYAEHCHKLEKEREQCVQNWQAGKVQVDALKMALEEHQVLLADKEHELEQRVQSAREKEWEKLVGIEKTKVELEERIAELQRCQLQNEEDGKIKLQTLEDCVHKLQTSKSNLESEIEAANFQCQEKVQQLQSLAAEVQKLSKISKKYQILQAEHASLKLSEHELKDVENKLQGTVHLLEEHLSKANKDMHKIREKFQQELNTEKQLWCEEKQMLSARVEECQSQQQALSGQLADANKTTKKIQKHYHKQVQGLKQTVELLRAKEEELITEKETLKKATALQMQNLKRKLTEMQRKHKEFLFLLHHIDPISSLTALESGQGTGNNMHKKQEEEGLMGDTNTIVVASQQQQTMFQQQDIWPNAQQSYSETSLTDSPI